MDDRTKARILDELIDAGLVDAQTVAEVERSIEEDTDRPPGRPREFQSMSLQAERELRGMED